MKLFKILICFVISPLILIAWTVDPKFSESSDYHYNYEKCVFTIKVDKWTKDNGRDVLPVIATLDNISNDTLKYEMMTYHMLAFFIKSDCLEYEYANEDILKNIPEFVIVAPHKKQTYSFNLVKKDTLKKVVGNLKIGFCLVFPKYPKPLDFYIHLENPFAYLLDDHGKEIPHDSDLKKRTHWLWSNSIDPKALSN